MDNPIVPLHFHSHWSLLDGVPSVQQAVDFAQAACLPALALTDTNALYGAIEFTSCCRQAGLQPILGVELTLTGLLPGLGDACPLVLLACNLEGYANLCRLVTRWQTAHLPVAGSEQSQDAARLWNGKPRSYRHSEPARGLGLADLAHHTNGLIALTGGRAGPLDAALRSNNDPLAYKIAHELVDLFGREHCFVELQLVEPGDCARLEALHALAGRLGLPVVATHDIRYLSPDDAPRYRVLTAMRQGRRLADLPPLPDLSFPPPARMQREFADFPGALENTLAIAQQCRFDFPLGQIHFPSLDLPSGRTPGQELWSLACAGAQQRYGALSPAIDARLRKEIEVIDDLGYAPYFLVVADIVRFARQARVPVSPRGSASSSVVAYCIGIHDVDPIAHNLYFERFLSPERRDPPDIDLDLCSRRRDEVIEYVYHKYGADHVAMVCTYTTLRARFALREVGKVYALPEARLKELSRQLPGFWHPGARKQVEDIQARLLDQARDPLEREVLTISRALDGAPHHLSIHPGGIVISPGPITDLTPLQYAAKGLLITQYDLESIEALGLVKIDLLGISALTVVADCVELIRRREPGFALESIPLDDAKTAQTLQQARTIGCFQIESPGMRMTLRELAARRVDDLIAALALYRPGPLKGGLKDAFVRRHKGQEAADYLHPALESVLRETYGVILYQEQVLRIAHEVAGLTLGQADSLRRAMSRHHLSREMSLTTAAGRRVYEQFIAGAQAVGGLDQATAEQVWEWMAAFAGYGFPKAHAAGYAALAYRMAYLKTHYPAEYMAARLAVWGGYYSPRVYMAEARRLGLAVRPPHVNHSGRAFTLATLDPQSEIGNPKSPIPNLPSLWMGLDQVRDLTHVSQKHIIARRPFVSLDDLLARANLLHIEAVNLVKAGALEGLGNPKAMLAWLESERWPGRHTGQMRLNLVEAVNWSEPDARERVGWELEVLGTPVNVHPAQLVRAELARRDLAHSDELAACAGQVVTLIGVRLAAHRFSADRPGRMMLVDMEDETGMYQVLWSGAALERGRPVLSQRGPLLVRGQVRADRQGQALIVGHEVTPIAGAEGLAGAGR